MSGPSLEDVRASLAEGGWKGFSLLRRYIAEHPSGSRLLAQRIRTVEWERRADWRERTVRWAILSDHSTANLHDHLLLESLARGVVPLQYHAPASHFSREVLDPASALWAHAPDVVAIAVSPPEAWAEGRSADDGAAAAAFVDSLTQKLRLLRDRCAAPILVHNFLSPEFRPLGMSDWREPGGLGERFARLNLALAEACRPIPDTHVLDVTRLAALAGARWWSIHKTRFLGIGLPEEVAPLLCREYAAVGAALRGLVRKCLVVDLDDTLWGGIVGEVGVDGIQIGESHPGNIYREIQRTVRRLREAGVVLAVNSRNDEDDAWEPFRRRPEMVLRREDFAAWRINWRDKVANLRELSEELRLGLDSFVVLDDDPVNRGWIEAQLPEVHVLPAQDPLDMLRTLATSLLFDGLSRTSEDALRASSYAASPLRRAAERDAVDREAFLAGLDLVVTIGRARSDQLARLAQLSQRTNQFNLTTRRYTHAQLAELREREDAEVLFCSCRDRFADEGITGLAILRKHGPDWSVDSFLLSCRVLGWGVERALAAAVCDIAAGGGARALLGEFMATAKNRQTEGFYRELGFSELSSSEARSTWRLELPVSRQLAPRWIRLRVEADGE